MIGLFDLDYVLKYKVRHRDGTAWQKMLRLIQSLASKDLRIANIGDFVPERLAQNKDNENRLDAIICAYVAAYWWKYGTERSMMVGDTKTGYIVTPHNVRTRLPLQEIFREQINMGGCACAPPQVGQQPPRAAVPRPGSASEPLLVTEQFPVEPSDGWKGPVRLRATDTTN